MFDYWEYLFQFIVLLIQKADDEDIGILLNNCNVDFSDYKIDKFNKNIYKDILFTELFVTNFNIFSDIKNENYDLVRDRINSSAYIEIYQHLLALCSNFYSFNFKLRSAKELTQVFHTLINNYTQNQFYYSFDNKNFTKIVFSLHDETLFNNGKNIHKPWQHSITESDSKKFLITKNDNKTILYNSKTGAKIELDVLLKTRRQQYTYQSFIEANDSILLALKEKGTRQDCTWCNPSNKKGSKCKCENCKNLLEELIDLQKQINDKDLNKWNFNLRIREIELNHCDNDYIALRRERKRVIEKFLQEVSNKTKKCKAQQKRIRSLMRTSFEA